MGNAEGVLKRNTEIKTWKECSQNFWRNFQRNIQEPFLIGILGKISQRNILKTFKRISVKFLKDLPKN